jgi:hypothetical protein
MSTITRRLPQSIISLKKALNKGVMMNNSLPPAQRFLPPMFETELNEANTALNTAYGQEAIAEGNYANNNRDLGLSVGVMRKYASHFIQVMNLAIDREDDNFDPGDRGYYQLPDGTVPNMDSEANAFLWAGNIIAGEAGRMAEKPGAVAMSNPDISKVAALHASATTFLDQENVLVTALTNARGTVQGLLEPGKLTVTKLWNYLETQYLHLNDSARRDILREWGVVYISEGDPAILNGLVLTAGGQPKEGVTVTLAETGATSTTNADGRYNLPSTFIGTGELLFHFPAEPISPHCPSPSPRQMPARPSICPMW